MFVSWSLLFANILYLLPSFALLRYPVSNYARDLLNKFYSEPVFTAVPKDIYERVPLMAQARVSLSQYSHMTCHVIQSLAPQSRILFLLCVCVCRIWGGSWFQSRTTSRHVELQDSKYMLM